MPVCRNGVVKKGTSLFCVILNEVKNLNVVRDRDPSLRSGWQLSVHSQQPHSPVRV